MFKLPNASAIALMIALGSTMAHAETKPAAPPSDPFVFTAGEIKLSDGKVHVTDEVPAKPFQVVLLNVAAAVQGLSNAPDAKAAVKLGFDTDAKGTFAYDGSVQLTPMRADGKVAFSGFRLAAPAAGAGRSGHRADALFGGGIAASEGEAHTAKSECKQDRDRDNHALTLSSASASSRSRL